jgi:hypothetical protein
VDVSVLAPTLADDGRGGDRARARLLTADAALVDAPGVLYPVERL